ncbi:MAG: HAD family phosphatase [Chlamydiae bacterium]|nr:HAD family phosphatase [Chlamydiota bacterium]MBI3277392.1 HAD family phosphatase [Chlamydiota bacterium]
MKTIKAILFDIGNVILFFDNHRVSRQLSEKTGKTESKLFKLVFDLYTELELDLGKTPPEKFLGLIQKEMDLKLDIAELKFIFSNIFQENERVSNLIKLLKWKISILAVSNTNESHFEFIRGNFPILHWIDRIIPSCEMGVKKPHPGIYFEALKYARAKPEECIFIDDQEKNIIPAHLLGFKTHLYKSYEGLVEFLSKLKII